MSSTGENILGSVPRIVTNEEGLYEGDLVHYFQVFFRQAKNLRNPYHNFRHTCHVLWLCHEAAKFYRDRLSPRDVRNLLIAAIFHDFDHTGCPGPDKVNIDRAQAALDRCLLPGDREQHLDELIAATEYPYSVPTDTLNLMARILRDADVGQAFSVAWIQQVIFGLSAEWGKDPMAVLEMQEPFYRSLRFHTDWGEKTFPPAVIEAKIAEARELLRVLTMPAAGAAEPAPTAAGGG